MSRCKLKTDEKVCKKKIKLTDFPCSYCKKPFCCIHRLPESHNCIYDFKSDKSELIKQLQKCIPSKIEKINK